MPWPQCHLARLASAGPSAMWPQCHLASVGPSAMALVALQIYWPQRRLAPAPLGPSATAPVPLLVWPQCLGPSATHLAPVPLGPSATWPQCHLASAGPSAMWPQCHPSALQIYWPQRHLAAPVPPGPSALAPVPLGPSATWPQRHGPSAALGPSAFGWP